MVETASVNYELLDDDLFEGQVNEDAYPDPPSPRPIPEGTYMMKLTAVSLDVNKDGTLRGDIKNPQVVINTEVVAPTSTQEKYARAVGRQANFLRVGSRKNSFRDGASDLGDLVRAFEKSARWDGKISNACRLLEMFAAEGRPGKLRVRWSAWDKAFWSQQGGDNLDKEGKKALRKQCQIRGEGKFKEDGTCVGPSGETLTARLEFAAAYPSE